MSWIRFNTQQEWVAAMQKAAQYYTSYANWYPNNLLYWNGSVLSADCVNLQKALFNGGDPFNLQYGMNAGDFPNNTGDCTEWGLITQCTECSQNFALLKYNEPRILYMDGHIGAYIGKEVSINGNIYNVIECTAWTGDFGHTGIIYTYVDAYGRRLNHKGGYQSCTWEWHGKPTKWVKYVAQPTPKIDEDGEWGVETTKLAQKIFGTEIDGIVSNQPKALKKYCLNCLTESWEFNNSGGYSPLIVAIQKWVGAEADGQFGPYTIMALQRKLGVEVDGYCGPVTVKAFQKYLNSKA